MKRFAYILTLFFLLCIKTVNSYEGGFHCDRLLPLCILDYFETETIFLGRVIDFDAGKFMSTKFLVERGYKNSKDNDTIEIISKLPDEGDVLYKLTRYGRWLVFVKSSDWWKGRWQNPEMPVYGNIFVSYCDKLIKDTDSTFESHVQFLEDVKSRCDGYNIFYYPGTKAISGEGMVKNNKPDGNWTFYYPDGELRTIGFYKSGIKDSIWWTPNMPHDYEKISIKEIWKNGQIIHDDWNGMSYQYNKDTVIDSKRYDDGETIKGYRLKNSQFEFKTIYYFDNGKIKKLDSADYHIEYYDTGKPKTIDTATFYKEFDENDKLLWHIDYVNNKRVYPVKDEYDTLRYIMKSHADSILVSYFGKCFFDKYIRFNIKNSFLSDSETTFQSEWFKKVDFLIQNFSLAYDIKFSDSLKFPTIYISVGKDFVPRIMNNFGVKFNTKKPVFECDNFIDYYQARNKFRDLGFINDSTPYILSLEWIKNLEFLHKDLPYDIMLAGKYYWQLIYLENKRTSTYNDVYMDLFDGSISNHFKDYRLIERSPFLNHSQE